MFKTLVGKEVTVILKNELEVAGTLQSVDQFLNIKLLGIRVADPAQYHHLHAVKDCFIRGSVVRYISVPPAEVDTSLLQDHTRRAATTGK